MLSEIFFNEFEKMFELERRKKLSLQTKKSFLYQNESGYYFSNKKEITSGEQNLNMLLQNIFGDLFVFSNPFLKKGEELCDILIIYRNHIIIFSDKESQNKTAKDLYKAWGSFYKKNIEKSDKQLIEANKAIKNEISKRQVVFINERDENEAIAIDLSGEIKIHLISILSGIKTFKKYGEASFFMNKNDSLSIDQTDYQSSLDKQYRRGTDKILSISNKHIEEGNSFIHTLDSISFENVCNYFNTPLDFIEYIVFREGFIKDNKEVKYVISSEMDLVAAYFLKNMKELSSEEYTCNKSILDVILRENDFNKRILNDFIVIDYLECSFESLSIDCLLQYLAYTGNHSNSHLGIENLSFNEQRKSMEFYYSLKRIERIKLYFQIKKSFNDMINSHQLRSGYTIMEFNNKIFICFFYLLNHSSKEEYRKRRAENALKILCEEKEKDKNCDKDIFILAMDHPSVFFTNYEHNKTSSFDFYSYFY